jgi:hypothetical protein
MLYPTAVALIQVSVQQCKVQASRFCDKLTNDFPYPVEKQACHSDPYKRCEMERRSRPKKVKRYSYNKQCVPVSRQVRTDVLGRFSS